MKETRQSTKNVTRVKGEDNLDIEDGEQYEKSRNRSSRRSTGGPVV